MPVTVALQSINAMNASSIERSAAAGTPPPRSVCPCKPEGVRLRLLKRPDALSQIGTFRVLDTTLADAERFFGPPSRSSRSTPVPGGTRHPLAAEKLDFRIPSTSAAEICAMIRRSSRLRRRSLRPATGAFEGVCRLMPIQPGARQGSRPATRAFVMRRSVAQSHIGASYRAERVGPVFRS